MRRFTLVVAAMALLGVAGPAGATFSIVAVDPATGQVGSAGASCISGSLILSDVLPGTGGIHTQAYWNAQNQANAHARMEEGYSPQEIVDWLAAHDAQGNPTIRQYGVVDLVGGGRSAAYTGVNCTNWKGHLLGPAYAIQGNILLGPEILDAMEAAFLGTPGTLADRLMAALQGANVPGADTRCLDEGKPAISAFLRVANPGDPEGDLYLHLNVNNTTIEQNPIDILQGLYDDWLASQTAAPAGPAPAPALRAQPNPFNPRVSLSLALPEAAAVTLSVHDLSGRLLRRLLEGQALPAGESAVAWDGKDGAGRPLASGVYLCRLEAGERAVTVKLSLLR